MAYDNAIPSYESILEFQEVYLRAIALIWRDEYEAEEKGEEPTLRKEFEEDPMTFLQMQFNYNCPWNINLEVESTPDSCKWIPSEPGECGKAGKWENLPPNGMLFGFPNKPKDELDEGIALAAYNDSGPVYLFTCC